MIPNLPGQWQKTDAIPVEPSSFGQSGSVRPVRPVIPIQPARWQKKNDITVGPLSFDYREGIQQLLEASGGALPLGKVTQEFPGLKRAQLEGIFELTKVGLNGQFEVRLPDCVSTGVEIMFKGQAVSKDEPLPPLDQDSIACLRSALEQAPCFTMSMGQMRKIVPEVRREQLENDFQVTRVDKKHFTVSLRQEDGGPALEDQGKGRQEAFHDFQVTGSTSRSMYQPVRTLVQDYLAATPLVEPLSFAQKACVHQLLEEAGGALPLGKVCQHFPGLKRTQLEGIFELSRVGQHGQFEVRLPGCVSTGVEIMVNDMAVSKDEVMPPLDEDSIANIRHALEQNPGCAMTMPSVREIVPGVRREQLEKDFQVIRVDKKHFAISLMQEGVSLSGSTGPSMDQPLRTFQDYPAAKRPRILAWV